MAIWYDNNSKQYRIPEMKKYAALVHKLVQKGTKILDIATGPGYLPIELAKYQLY